MSAPVYFASIGLVLGTIILIFAMRYLAATRQARASTSGEDAYRTLAERAVTAQTSTAATLSSLQTEVLDIRTRLTGVEKVLKEVG